MRIIGRWAAVIILGGVCAARAGTLHVSLLGDDGNDGLSWAAPLRTIQAAVAAARDQGHALVLVSNGIWSSTSSIVVTNAITVRAFSPDPAATTINGSGGRPVFWLGHPGAVADGFLIRDIYVANADGGGIWANSLGTIRNCIVWGNQAGAGNKQNIRKAANTTLVNTLVTLSPGVTGTDTVDADPQFIDSGAGDYRLLPGSPAIDAGDNQTWQETALDYAGSLRRAGRVDLGAFEALAPDAGPFRVNFTNTLCRGATELEVVFTAHAAGADTNGLTYSWDFGGGHMSGAELRVVTNTF